MNCVRIGPKGSVFIQRQGMQLSIAEGGVGTHGRGEGSLRPASEREASACPAFARC